MNICWIHLEIDFKLLRRINTKISNRIARPAPDQRLHSYIKDFKWTNLFLLFFSIRVFFHTHWRFRRQKEGDDLDFFLSLPRAHKHSDIHFQHVIWISRIFNNTALTSTAFHTLLFSLGNVMAPCQTDSFNCFLLYGTCLFHIWHLLSRMRDKVPLAWES